MIVVVVVAVAAGIVEVLAVMTMDTEGLQDDLLTEVVVTFRQGGHHHHMVEGQGGTGPDPILLTTVLKGTIPVVLGEMCVLVFCCTLLWSKPLCRTISSQSSFFWIKLELYVWSAFLCQFYLLLSSESLYYALTNTQFSILYICNGSLPCKLPYSGRRVAMEWPFLHKDCIYNLHLEKKKKKTLKIILSGYCKLVAVLD